MIDKDAKPFFEVTTPTLSVLSFLLKLQKKLNCAKVFTQIISKDPFGGRLKFESNWDETNAKLSLHNQYSAIKNCSRTS